MFKKKGGLAFKPKVPQARRAVPTSSLPASTQGPEGSSTERQSKTPAPRSSSDVSVLTAPQEVVRTEDAAPVTTERVSESSPAAAGVTSASETDAPPATVPESEPVLSTDLGATRHEPPGQQPAVSLARESVDEGRQRGGARSPQGTAPGTADSIEKHVEGQPEEEQSLAEAQPSIASSTFTTTSVPPPPSPSPTAEGKNPSEMQTSTEQTPASKAAKAKPRAPRSRAPKPKEGAQSQPQPQPSIEVEVEEGAAREDVQPGASGTPKAKTTRKRKSQAIEDGTPAGSSASVLNEPQTDIAQPPQKQRATRRKKDTSTSASASASASNEEGSGETSQAAAQKPKKPRRKRSVTPEDAEEREVDHRSLKMGDLTKDLRIGKKFSRHDELLEREKQKRAKAKLAKSLSAGESGTEAGSTAGGGDDSPAPETAAKPQPSAPAPSGPQFQIIDGQIVVNQRSLVHDRHARAAAEAGELEEVEENDFTRLTTSATYLRPSKSGPNIWTDEETEIFYYGLRMLGTDFQMISRMIPGKERRHVKLKFNREERLAPRRINAALVGKKKITIDLTEYKSRTGLEYEQTAVIEEEMKSLQEEHEAQQRRVEEEVAEAARLRREALFGNGRSGRQEKSGSGDPSSSAAANGDAEDVEIIDEEANTGKGRGRGRGRGGRGKAGQPVAGGFGM